MFHLPPLALSLHRIQREVPCQPRREHSREPIQRIQDNIRQANRGLAVPLTVCQRDNGRHQCKCAQPGAHTEPALVPVILALLLPEVEFTRHLLGAAHQHEPPPPGLNNHIPRRDLAVFGPDLKPHLPVAPVAGEGACDRQQPQRENRHRIRLRDREPQQAQRAYRPQHGQYGNWRQFCRIHIRGAVIGVMRDADLPHLVLVEVIDVVEEVGEVIQMEADVSGFDADGDDVRIGRETGGAHRGEEGLWGRDDARDQAEAGDGDSLGMDFHRRLADDGEQANEVELDVGAAGEVDFEVECGCAGEVLQHSEGGDREGAGAGEEGQRAQRHGGS